MLHLDSTPLDVGSALAKRLDATSNLLKKKRGIAFAEL
jgi:hypothetical protein